MNILLQFRDFITHPRSCFRRVPSSTGLPSAEPRQPVHRPKPMITDQIQLLYAMMQQEREKREIYK
jgi:hypothetical protein